MADSIPSKPLGFHAIGRMGPPLRSFAADTRDCIVVRVLGPTAYKVVARFKPRPKAGSPLIVIPTACLARSNQKTDDGKNASPCLTQKAPYKGLCADSGEKHEPASDIDAAVVDSLTALDLSRPIREADSCTATTAAYSITSSARTSIDGGTSRPIGVLPNQKSG